MPLLHRDRRLAGASCSSCAAASVSEAQRSDANGRVQEQEQLQRRALVAGAAGRARPSNFLYVELCWI